MEGGADGVNLRANGQSTVDDHCVVWTLERRELAGQQIRSGKVTPSLREPLSQEVSGNIKIDNDEPGVILCQLFAVSLTQCRAGDDNHVASVKRVHTPVAHSVEPRRAVRIGECLTSMHFRHAPRRVGVVRVKEASADVTSQRASNRRLPGSRGPDQNDGSRERVLYPSCHEAAASVMMLANLAVAGNRIVSAVTESRLKRLEPLTGEGGFGGVMRTCPSEDGGKIVLLDATGHETRYLNAT